MTEENTPLKAYTVGEYLERDFPEVESLWGSKKTALLTPEGRFVLYGAPATRKSFFIMQMCFSLARGRDFLGYPVSRPTNVLYLQAELVAPMFKKRLELMQGEFGEPSNFAIFDSRSFNFGSYNDFERVEQLIKDYNSEFLFIDPLSQHLSCDENDNAQMREFFQELDLMAARTSCGIGIVHHPRKGETTGAGSDIRGWSGIEGWASLVVKLTNVRANGSTELRWDKTRDAAEEPMRSWLQFDKECGILRVSTEAPTTFIRQYILEMGGDSKIWWLDKTPAKLGLAEGIGLKPAGVEAGISLQAMNSTLDKLEHKGHIMRAQSSQATVGISDKRYHIVKWNGD